MKPTIADLADRLRARPGVDLASVVTGTDRVLSIGQDVVRFVHDRRVATAVTGDAPLEVTCGAIVDAIALLEYRLGAGTSSVDPTAVDVFIDRPPSNSGRWTETEQAVRSVATAAIALDVRIWTGDGAGGFMEDLTPAPDWPTGDERVSEWVSSLLLPRLTAHPHGVPLDLVGAVDDPSLHLYPSPVSATNTDSWSLRIDGLQIGIASSTTATLEIGEPGTVSDGPQRRRFIEVFGRPRVTVAATPSAGQLSVSEAAQLIRELLRRFRTVDVVGAPVTHRVKDDRRIVDEHALESRLLKGIVALRDDQPASLVLDDAVVARGSQIPTLWGHGAKPRYLDALVRDGRRPIAVELKVATGGQGRYYRRALVQAVLYRHFIANADDLDPWFDMAALDRSTISAAIGIPTPARWTERFERDLELLRCTAEQLGAEVFVLDDRRTPDRAGASSSPEPTEAECQRRSWWLAAGLSRRWNADLGRVIEIQGGGWQYDQLQLRSSSDLSTGLVSPRPRIELNRLGSARVRSVLGHESWVWRHIWSALQTPADVERAALELAAVAGLGAPQPSEQTSFAELASSTLDELAEGEWAWRSAWIDSAGQLADWFTPFRSKLQAFLRPAPDGRIPTVARLWGLVGDDDHAVAVVDHDTLRVWIRDNSGVELGDVNDIATSARARTRARNRHLSPTDGARTIPLEALLDAIGVSGTAKGWAQRRVQVDFLGRKQQPEHVDHRWAMAIGAAAQASDRRVPKVGRVYDLVRSATQGLALHDYSVVCSKGKRPVLVRNDTFDTLPAVVIDLAELDALVRSLTEDVPPDGAVPVRHDP